jgi:hypothetical protein
MVDSSIGLYCRPTRLQRLAGRYDSPLPYSSISPYSGTKNLVSGLHHNFSDDDYSEYATVAVKERFLDKETTNFFSMLCYTNSAILNNLFDALN